MLSWFPQSPVTSEAPTETKNTYLDEPPQPNDALPSHDRVLTNLFEDRSDSAQRATTLETSPTPVYDPFDGSLLGTMVPLDQNIQPEEVGPLNVVSKNEELWSHLSQVLDLQNEISRMHLAMEEVGVNATDPKGKGKASRSRAASISRVVIDDVEGEDGVGGTRDEEAERNRAREEQFAKLSGQFSGKKEAISEIMFKLESLSRAVTEFHALQAPKINFPSSRDNSLPATTTATEPPLMGGAPSIHPIQPSLFKRGDEPLVESPLSTTATLPS